MTTATDSEVVCNACGRGGADVLARAFAVKDAKTGNDNPGLGHLSLAHGSVGFYPVLCTDCCSTLPGRGWMRKGLR